MNVLPWPSRARQGAPCRHVDAKYLGPAMATSTSLLDAQVITRSDPCERRRPDRLARRPSNPKPTGQRPLTAFPSNDL